MTQDIERFTLNERIQHIILFVSLIVLALTGLALKYHNTWWGAFLINVEGGIQARGWIHRTAAIILTILGIYHSFYVVFTERGHRELMLMVPGIKDVRDFMTAVLASFGLRKDFPRYDKYGLVEKIQYWGATLGSLIMIVTGLILWFETQSMAVLPKWVLDITTVVHGYEGVLIFLVLFLWHMYITHLNPRNFPMNRTWLTGKISLEKLKEDHPLEFERITKEPGGKK